MVTRRVADQASRRSHSQLDRCMLSAAIFPEPRWLPAAAAERRSVGPLPLIAERRVNQPAIVQCSGWWPAGAGGDRTAPSSDSRRWNRSMLRRFTSS